MNLTIAQLRAIMPSLPEERAAFWQPYLAAAMQEFGITTPARAAAFLAQVAHESGELARLVENLNYGAAGLRKTWPSRFTDRAIAERYARRPMAIANKVYANRMGNGDEHSGDGWRFRGRSPMQVTGKANYEAVGRALGVPLAEHPELLEHPEHGSRAAGYFWHSRGLNKVVDAGESVADPDGPRTAAVVVSKVINQGSATAKGDPVGLADRLAFWKRARVALAVAA